MSKNEKDPIVVIGVDESGWGAWAGPFYVAACVLRTEHDKHLKSEGVRDSKRMSPAERSEALNTIFAYALEVPYHVASVAEIKSTSPADAHAEAVFTVVKKAVEHAVVSNVSMSDILVVIDGNPIGDIQKRLGAMDVAVRWVQKAESKYVAVAAASIVAKCFRDEEMIQMEKTYPGYGFDKHMGYGTADHQAALKKNGPCPEHRDVNIKSTRNETPRKETNMQTETVEKSTKKASKGKASKAPAKTKAAKPAKAATKGKATKALSGAAENFSRDPGPMQARLKNHIESTIKFAEHTVSRAQKFSDKNVEKKASKATSLLTKALEALN